MTEEEKAEVAFKIEDEGFDYCFDGYSDWRTVKDEEFHKLREAYLTAKKVLNNYIYD